MATLALAAAGATLGGATLGAQVGALAGAFVDQSLLAPSGHPTVAHGPRLSELRVTASSEGAPIPRLYGRARLGGQIIWATSIEEEVVQQGAAGGGGKGGAGQPASTASTASIEYRYFANFAVALAEGPITGIGRVWADGKELDLSAVHLAPLHRQRGPAPRRLIEAKEGAGNAPAYRGLAYIVFERMPLADFGNRIPQLSFEVYRAVDDFNDKVRAVCLIPGAGEFVYASQSVSRKVGVATNVSENVHTRQGGTDWDVAIDQLQAILPNAGAVSLVVGWFGNDLRAGNCTIRPGVEPPTRSPHRSPGASPANPAPTRTSSAPSTAARPTAARRPTTTVVAAIQDLDARGIAVTLAPFIFMDVAAGNALPDPYTGAASQPLYPWRGRITVAPAPGQPGTPDKTAAAATQVAAFVGTAAVSDFAIVDGEVVYSGPAEWSYRRFILHYAHLAAAAGGVDAFLIGSEMRGLTWVRDSASTYPFVAALVSSRRRRQGRARLRHQGHLRRRLVRVLRPPARRRLGRRLLPPRPAVVLRQHRRRRHRRLLAARRLARRRRATSTAWPASPRSTISTICAATSSPARATTGTTPAPATATRRRARPSPTAPTASPGCSASRTSAPGG